MPVRDVEQMERSWYYRRFSVKPGITCLWQVAGRSDVDFDDRLKLDVEYIERRNLGLDLWILLRTALVIFEQRGAY